MLAIRRASSVMASKHWRVERWPRSAAACAGLSEGSRVDQPMSSGQRGFWTFLFFTLVGPFLAAVGVMIALPILISMQVGPFAGANYGILDTSTVSPPQLAAFAAMTAVRAYVWSAIPAAITGVVYGVVVARGMYSGWGVVGSIGVFGFMLAVIAMPIAHGGLLAFIAVFAGFVAIGCRAVAVRAGVLRAEDG